MLFDSQSKIGKKILISGGGRCNITNAKMSEKHFNGSTNSFVRHILSQFTEKDTLDFFEKRGVPLKLEEEFTKYFPASNQASDILNAFTSFLAMQGVSIHTQKKLISLDKQEKDFICRFADGSEVVVPIVVMATGGLSVPKTGSDGSAFEVLKKMGHTTTNMFPALAPLQTNDPMLKKLAGYSCTVNMSLVVDGKRKASFTAPFLFTHFGYSGPVVLNLSRHYFTETSNTKKVQVSWLPDLNENDMNLILLDVANSKQNLNSILRKYLSKNMVELLLEKAQIPIDIKLNALTKPMRKNMLALLFHYDLPIDGSRGFAVAEATAGGIPFEEVQHGSLQSKKYENLFFCGEMLDVDGQLGGYNFQWAFASANTVATAVLKACHNIKSD